MQKKQVNLEKEDVSGICNITLSVIYSNDRMKIASNNVASDSLPDSLLLLHNSIDIDKQLNVENCDKAKNKKPSCVGESLSIN